MRKEWMFKLVGKEYFEVGKSRAKCCISIDAVSGFAYEYTIEVRISDSSITSLRIISCNYCTGKSGSVLCWNGKCFFKANAIIR